MYLYRNNFGFFLAKFHANSALICDMNIFFKFFLKFIKKNFVIIKGLIIFGNRLHKTKYSKC